MYDPCWTVQYDDVFADEINWNKMSSPEKENSNYSHAPFYCKSKI